MEASNQGFTTIAAGGKETRGLAGDKLKMSV
jgi:hypothetical protein